MNECFRSALMKLREEVSSADCWFLIDYKNGIQRKVACHKQIVGCASDVFKRMLFRESLDGVISIGDVEIDMIEKFLDYIYSYDAKIIEKQSTSKLIPLALFGHKYLVNSLLHDISKCLNVRASSMEMSDLSLAFELAQFLEIADLTDRISKVLRNRLSNVLVHENIFNFNPDVFESYLKTIATHIGPKISLEIIGKFLEKHVDKRDEYGRRFIRHVDFMAFSLQEFHEAVYDSTLLSDKEKYDLLFKICERDEDMEEDMDGDEH